MEQTDYFVVGGTLRPSSPSYVERPADQQLLNTIQEREFCYVLTPRQMGKSSLMIRTARRLEAQGERYVIVDLTSIGTVDAEAWYLGMVTRIRQGLRLEANIEEWWRNHASLGLPQRFGEFLRHVVLEEIVQPVTIFIDEIDTTLNLAFRDDFFAAIRAVYNERALDPILNRITFVLLGVATPAELIKDRDRTPFNIGQRIVLREFSLADAAPLRDGLEAFHPGQGHRLLTRIFHWTDGHPYLTQKLCLAAASQSAPTWDSGQVDALVGSSFFSEEGLKDTNLTFVQDRIEANPERERRRLIKLYKRAYEGQVIPDDDRSPVQNQLELTGLVRVTDDHLEVANRLYRRVFDADWIKVNTPVNTERRIAAVASIVALGLIAVLVYALLSIQEPADVQAQICVEQFRIAGDNDTRIEALSCLLGLYDGYDQYDDQALQLFYDELGADGQNALFTDLENPINLASQLVRVVSSIYVTLDWMADGRDRLLMEHMSFALLRAGFDQPDNSNGYSLREQLRLWQEARDATEAGQSQAALLTYTAAIEEYKRHPNIQYRLHPVMLYDRAMAAVALTRYDEALTDLGDMARVADEVPPTPTPTPADTTPTPTPTATLTPVSTVEAVTRLPTAEQPLGIGSDVRVTGVLPLGQSAGFANKSADDIIYELSAGSQLTIIDGPQSMDGLTWWAVRYIDSDGNVLDGWVAGTNSRGDALIVSSTLSPPGTPAPSLASLSPSPSPSITVSATFTTTDAVTQTFASLRFANPDRIKQTIEDTIASTPALQTFFEANRSAYAQLAWLVLQPLGRSEYIFGLNDAGGEQLMLDAGKPGWLVLREAIGSDPNDQSGVDYSQWTAQGLGVIVVLANGYNPEGTLPNSALYDDFAQRCAQFVRNSPGASVWVIGNEMNYVVERPGVQIDFADNFNIIDPGEVITPDLYVRAYRLCRQAIKALPGHENDQVLVGAVAPWNNMTTYPGNPNGDWVQYLRDILELLGPGNLDGITIHTYTHSADPTQITSNAMMNPPFQNRRFHFRAYQDFMEAIPAEMRHIPVYITETDRDMEWTDENSGWVQAAYAEINRWNSQPGNQKIHALALNRWQQLDRWGIEGKQGVIADFQQALLNDYRWSAPASNLITVASLSAAGGAVDDLRVARAVTLGVSWGDVLNWIATSTGRVDVTVELQLPDGPTLIDDLVFDPDQGKRLLAEAGFPDGFPVTILYPDDASELELLGREIANVLGGLGIEAMLAASPKIDDEVQTRIAAGETTLALDYGSPPGETLLRGTLIEQMPAPTEFVVRADAAEIASGECIRLTWSVQGVLGLYLDGMSVTGEDSRVVCPPETTTYTWIADFDTRRETKALTIVVQPVSTPTGIPASVSAVIATRTPAPIASPTPTQLNELSVTATSVPRPTRASQAEVVLCKQLLEEFKVAFDECSELPPGWACYGSGDVVTSPVELRFYMPGDRLSLASFDSIETVSRNGAVVINARSLPEDQEVTLLAANGALYILDAKYILDANGICTPAPPALIIYSALGTREMVMVNGVSIQLRP